MNSSNHCKTSIFEGDIKFQYVMGDLHIHNTTQNAMLTFFMDEWV